MITRRKEKIQRKFQERQKLEHKINTRMYGQAIKDNGRWFRTPDKRSPSRREKKKLKKLNKIIRNESKT